MTTLPAGRRHDLDWLRVCAFALLIFYHVGMFYVTWDWHIKSDHAASTIEPAMAILNPWRLALLFFVSGAAFRFASDKRGRAAMAGNRLRRLLVPVLFGMLVVVPPQTYLELRYDGVIGPGVWPFYHDYLRLEQVYPVITPTWNHLWYVVYLLAYTLLALALLPLLQALARALDADAPAWLGARAWPLVVLPALPFIFFQLVLAPRFPVTHALVDDWANHANMLTLFLLGYVAVRNAAFWRAVQRSLPTAATLAILLAAGLFCERIWRGSLPMTPELAELIRLARVFYAWVAILALLGIAQRYLNRASPALNYLSEAVFSYYILHQTIIVLVAFPFIGSGAPVWVEATAIVLSTIIGCLVLYELVIRRIFFLRPLFGLKPVAPPAVANPGRPAPENS